MGIVHRDLKPENILCVEPGSIKRIKICDFGISKIMTDKNTGIKTRVETLEYTAPEILKGEKYNKSVDYWSVGIIMHILLCGYPPFMAETDEQVCIKCVYFFVSKDMCFLFFFCVFVIFTFDIQN